MPILDYAAMTTLVTRRIQSAGTADFSVAEVDDAIQFSLAEAGEYHPHKVGVIFKLEGRKGRATSTSADNLVDTTNGQFLAGDATNEKVIHNTTDYTWAVVLSLSSTSQIGISADIMAVNELYEIYNKRCINRRQLYLGDVPNNYTVIGAEYPIGTKRNWKQSGDILELDIDHVPNTNTNTAVVSNSADADVMVRFQIPHALPNLTDWTATFTAAPAVGATSIALTALQSAGTIAAGAELTIENHRSTYVVASSATIASSAVTLPIYPGLEAAVSSTAWVVTFRKTSLEPKFEDLVADLSVARLAIDKSIKYANSLAITGGNVQSNFLNWGERRLAETLSRLRRSVPPKISHSYPSDVL